MKTILNAFKCGALVILALLCHATQILAQSAGLPPVLPGCEYITNSDGSIGMTSGATPSDDGGGGFRADDSGPPVPAGGAGPGSGGGSGPFIPTVDPGTNLWLLIQQASNAAVITFSNTVAGLPYVLLSTTNLATGPWLTNQSFLATNAVSLAPLPVSLEGPAMFFAGVQESPGSVRWIIPAGLGDTAPALSEDSQTVYVAGGLVGSNALYAFDLFTGATDWVSSIYDTNLFASSNVYEQAPPFYGSPAVAGDLILAPSPDGTLYCLRPDGTTNWKQSLGAFSAIYTTPAVQSNRVFVTTAAALPGRQFAPPTGLFCLNLADGSSNWLFQPQDPSYGTGGDICAGPVLDAAGNIYFVTFGRRLYAVSSTGQLRWFLPLTFEGFQQQIPMSLSIDGTGLIYVQEQSVFIDVVNSDGSLHWTTEFSDDLLCSWPIDTNNVAYCAVNNNLIAYSNSIALWTNDVSQNAYYGSPVLGANGTVFVGDDASDITAFTNGQIAWTVPTDDCLGIYSPLAMAADGTVLALTHCGNLAAVWSGTAPATQTWPSFQHDAQHTGAQPLLTPPAPETLPFVFDATNDGMGDFSFSIAGSTNSAYDVYYSANLSNWVYFSTVSLEAPGADDFGTNTVTDSTVAGLDHRYYEVTASGQHSAAIGFQNLTIDPGTNLIGDPFYQVDDSIVALVPETPMNTLNALFIVYDPWGPAQYLTEVEEWDGQEFIEDLDEGAVTAFWGNGGHMTLVPGTGMLMENPNTNSFPISFAGLVREQQIVTINNPTNYLSPTAPLAGWITNVTGYRPDNGDVVETVTNGIWMSYTYTNNAWLSNKAPYLEVGQGFVLLTTNTYTWTNSWRQMVSPP